MVFFPNSGLFHSPGYIAHVAQEASGPLRCNYHRRDHFLPERLGLVRHHSPVPAGFNRLCRPRSGERGRKQSTRFRHTRRARRPSRKGLTNLLGAFIWIVVLGNNWIRNGAVGCSGQVSYAVVSNSSPRVVPR